MCFGFFLLFLSTAGTVVCSFLKAGTKGCPESYQVLELAMEQVGHVSLFPGEQPLTIL